MLKKLVDTLKESFLTEICTYDFFEDVDFVEEHTLLVLVHIALSEDLDGSLGTGLSVHTHTDLSEGTCTKILSAKMAS